MSFVLHGPLSRPRFRHSVPCGLETFQIFASFSGFCGSVLRFAASLDFADSPSSAAPHSNLLFLAAGCARATFGVNYANQGDKMAPIIWSANSSCKPL